MPGTNEAKHVGWYETYMCRCKRNISACNNEKCRCEWKELIDKAICDKRFVWNPSNYECECDKSCDMT